MRHAIYCRRFTHAGRKDEHREPSNPSVSAGRDDLVQSTTTPSLSDRPASAGQNNTAQLTTTLSPSDRPVSAGQKDLVQLTTPFLLGRLPLLGPRDSNDRFGDHDRGASPVNIGRPLNTIFYIKNDIGSLAVGPTQRRDHEPSRRRARARKAYRKDVCLAKDLSADAIAQRTRSCSGHTLTPSHRRSNQQEAKDIHSSGEGVPSYAAGWGRAGTTRMNTSC